MYVLGVLYNIQVLLNLDFEEETDDASVVRSTAFCGRQSYVRPTLLWEGTPFRTSIYTHVSATTNTNLSYCSAHHNTDRPQSVLNISLVT